MVGYSQRCSKVWILYFTIIEGTEFSIFICSSLFVSAEMAYNTWLKVLLAGLVREKNTVQTIDYKPDTSE